MKLVILDSFTNIFNGYRHRRVIDSSSNESFFCESPIINTIHFTNKQLNKLNSLGIFFLARVDVSGL